MGNGTEADGEAMKQADDCAAVAQATAASHAASIQRMPEQQEQLTFDQASAAFAALGHAWDARRYDDPRTLLLLSDRNPFAIKVIRFGDDNETSVIEQQSFGGSAIVQFERAMQHLAAIDECAAGIAEDPMREQALREALLNGILHRDYGYTGPLIVNVYPSHVDVISLGGLVGGLQINDLLNGISQPRNELLVRAFVDLGIARGFGSGIRMIMRAYQSSAVSPQLRVGPASVAVILPLLPDDAAAAARASDEDGAPHAQDDEGQHAAKRYRFPAGGIMDAQSPLAVVTLALRPVPDADARACTPRPVRMTRSAIESAALAYLIKCGTPVPRAQIQKPLNLTKNQVNYALTHLVASGLVRRVGSSRATQYCAVGAGTDTMRA